MIEAKRILKASGSYSYYYDKKSEEFRVCIAKFKDSTSEESKRKEEALVIGVLNELTANGLRPKFRRESKLYQGFLDCKYIIFE